MIRLAFVILGAIAVAPVSAAPILYTITGSATATIGSTSHTGSFSLTGSGNAGTDLDSRPDVIDFKLDSVVLTMDGITATSTDPMDFYLNTTQGIATFNQIRPGNSVGGLLYVHNDAFMSYDGTSNFGPLSGQYYGNGATFDTSAGIFEIKNYDYSVAPTFQARLSSTAPEPNTWAMTIVGFGAIGTALRRRRTGSGRDALGFGVARRTRTIA